MCSIQIDNVGQKEGISNGRERVINDIISVDVINHYILWGFEVYVIN